MITRVDVTQTVRLARECCRAVWNQHYRLLMEPLYEFDVWEACKSLRKTILTDYLELAHGAASPLMVSWPATLRPGCILKKTMTTPQSAQYEEAEALSGEDTFLFNEFFDFDTATLVDLAYCEFSPANAADDRYILRLEYCQFYLLEDIAQVPEKG